MKLDRPQLAQALRDEQLARGAAYSERNVAVIAFARCAIALGWSAGRHWDDGDNTHSDYRHTVLVDLPTGEQLAWHVHRREVGLLDDLPVHPHGIDRPRLISNTGAWCDLIPLEAQP